MNCRFHLTLTFVFAVTFASLSIADESENKNAPKPDRPGAISLFNGKDLTSWKGDTSLWSVEDGCITGKTNGPDHLEYNKFLIWDGKVADFVFDCDFRLEGNNNSGVQYRSRHDEKRGEWVVAGYLADIHANPQYTGMLYDEKGRGIVAKRGEKVVIGADGKKVVSKLDEKLWPFKDEGQQLDLTKWHSLAVVAIGNRSLHFLDGKLVADITDEQESERELEGVLALQVHRGQAMKAQFRRLKLTELKGETSVEEFLKSNLKNAFQTQGNAGKSVGDRNAAAPGVGVSGRSKKLKPKATATLAAAAPLREPTATPIADLKVAKGFQVELLYSVPKDQQGSWVSTCIDPQGRLIVSDQYGSLYRVTPAQPGAKSKTMVEKINVDIGEAQGLLWAFDSLYVNVNKGQKYEGGLYRVTDEDGDGELDTVKMLRPLKGTGEHGPHAVLPHPDGKSLVVICGNRTEMTEIATSRVPRNWDEDNLLPRVQGRFMRGTRAPGGFICRIDPEGKQWELMATGFRNQFDGAFNADGELLTYDADMEWDFNLPWYRPTRICHAVSGAEFGWRSGGGKFPVYYDDSLPPVVNVGPGSPTGVCFGYGAKFPAKYQKAFFACDWSYGKLYATHLTPDGSTYSGQLEEFISGTPLPLTDVIVNPHDGAMYFTIGGRKVQSGLYRVTYVGQDSTAPADLHEKDGEEQRAVRRMLEDLHLAQGDHDANAKIALPHLGSSDRFVRFAARVALENNHGGWKLSDLNTKDPDALLTGLMAYVRGFKRTELGKEPDIDTPAPGWGGVVRKIEDAGRAQARESVLTMLQPLDWKSLSHSQKLKVVRVLSLTFLRIGPPASDERDELLARVNAVFPEKSRELNSELAQLMVYLQHPKAAGKIVAQLVEAPTQEEQIDLARTLRHLKAGWTPELRQAYFEWLVRAQSYRGGASFQVFVNNIRDEAMLTLSPEEKVALKPILDAKPEAAPTFTRKPRPVVKKYTMQDLVPLVQTGLKNRDFDAGRKLFGEAACFACHRFDNQGGAVGPDLTILSGRFSSRDILESIVEPSKQISDQYGSVNLIKLDGKVVHGRIINLAGDSFRVQTDMLNPGSLVNVDRKQIDEMIPSKISMMPEGLLNVLKEEEILDLMAYLLSRGDRANAMFKQE